MDEVRFFGRISLYALVVGVAYWFLSYEPAGTVLLIGFGLATGAGFLVLRGAARRGDGLPAGRAAPGTHDGASEAAPGALESVPAALDGAAGAPDGPFGDESGPVPTRSAAPLAVGFGAAAMALAGAFGPWFLIAGIVPLLLGAVEWLRAADRELELRTGIDAVEASDRTAEARPPEHETEAVVRG